MSAIVPFESSQLPSFLRGVDVASINREVVNPAAFPVMSIKGKTFAIVRDGVRTVLTKPDDPDEVAQSINVVVVRANLHAKTFYAKRYTEGDEGARPDCYSLDGVAPSPNSANPQAKKCALCPHNQWGSRVGDDGEASGKGKACQDNARLAITAPDNIEPMLLRVPPASLKALRDTLKLIAARKVAYNAVVVKIGFDREAPSPRLTFKPVDFVTEAQYARITAEYDSDTVRAIVGLDDVAPPKQTDEAGAEPAAVESKTEEAPKQEAKQESKQEPKQEPKREAKATAKPKREPEPTSDDDDLSIDLDGILNALDD